MAEYAVIFDYGTGGYGVRRWYGRKTWTDPTCIVEPDPDGTGLGR